MISSVPTICMQPPASVTLLLHLRHPRVLENVDGQIKVAMCCLESVPGECGRGCTVTVAPLRYISMFKRDVVVVCGVSRCNTVGTMQKCPVVSFLATLLVLPMVPSVALGMPGCS